MSVECGSCGKHLSEDFAGMPCQPCPDCGATARVLSASASSSANATTSTVASLRYGHTGREVLGAKDERRAIEWASLPNHDAVLNHDVAAYFRAVIASAQCLSGDSLVLFRGQGIPESEQRPPTIERMGPLPVDRTPREGRYHREGERVLYLADSENGVRREMEAWHTKGTPFVIRVEVPVSKLRIADFSEWPSDNFVTAVFARAELCKYDHRGPGDYIFSQAVAEIVSARFDGMRIPGVRGVPGAHYKNVVLFRGLDDWPKWTNPASPAYRMFPPPNEHISVAAYYLWEKDGRVHGRDQAHWFRGIHELP
jgi:hypothetical protein